MTGSPVRARDRAAVRERQGKILVAKLGLDGHDVGAKVVATLLRDAGFEVVYLGIRQTAEAVFRTAVDEDVDLVGLSILSGSHMALAQRVLGLLREMGDDIPPVVMGGVIPPEDREPLLELGVSAVFTAGTPTSQMLDQVRDLVAGSRHGG
jgi:methylmalonyl-CoA mutase, C-terminal domain